jgi:hypothetical protein
MVNASKPISDPDTDLHCGVDDLFPICAVTLSQRLCDKVSA